MVESITKTLAIAVLYPKALDSNVVSDEEKKRRREEEREKRGRCKQQQLLDATTTNRSKGKERLLGQTMSLFFKIGRRDPAELFNPRAV